MHFPKIGLEVNLDGGEGRGGGGIMAWGKGKGQKFDCNIPQKFCVDNSSRSVLRRGRSRRGTWRMLRVPDLRQGWQGHS